MLHFFVEATMGLQDGEFLAIAVGLAVFGFLFVWSTPSLIHRLVQFANWIWHH